MVNPSKKGKGFISTGSIENAFAKVWAYFQKLRGVKAWFMRLRLGGVRSSRKDNVGHFFFFFFLRWLISKTKANRSLSSDQNKEFYWSSKTEVISDPF